MVLIAVVAMLFLPCVFGGCCLPERVSGRLIRNWKGALNNTFLIDFAKNKMLQRAIPPNGDYSVTDLCSGKEVDYFGVDKTCKNTKDLFLQGFPRCIPSYAVQIPAGESTVETWEFKYGNYFQGIKRFRMTVNGNSCAPVTAVYSFTSPDYDMIDFEFDPNPQASQADLDDLNRRFTNCYGWN